MCINRRATPSPDEPRRYRTSRFECTKDVKKKSWGRNAELAATVREAAAVTSPVR